jgi:hypothetical protein
MIALLAFLALNDSCPKLRKPRYKLPINRKFQRKYP